MKLVTRLALLLIACVVLLAAADKGSTNRETCLANCRGNCTKSYDACLKSGKNKDGCKNSRDVCNAVCANKTCPEPPPPPPKK